MARRRVDGDRGVWEDVYVVRGAESTGETRGLYKCGAVTALCVGACVGRSEGPWSKRP